MAAPTAAGSRTASSSTKHTPKQDGITFGQIIAQLTPDMFDKILTAWAEHDGTWQEAARRFREAMNPQPHAALSRPVTPAQLEALAQLREPFPESAISVRPQPWCRACSDADGKVCSKHKEVYCERCQRRITDAHTDLDYVGHAEITDRLLKVDPTWDWEPLTVDERGQPVFDQHNGLWIRLTVAGLSRIGYGDAVNKRPGPLAVKETIGDALRNAGMRFGMALELWAKTDLHRVIDVKPHPAERYVEAMRKAWGSAVWLEGLRQEIETDGHLDYQVPDGGGATLAQVIDGQLGHLAESARIEAELRLEREEKKAAAAAQVAAEAAKAGVPVTEGPPTIEGLRKEAAAVWKDPHALEKVLLRAQLADLAAQPLKADQPPGGPTFGARLREQITGLRAQARAGQRAQRPPQPAQPAPPPAAVPEPPAAHSEEDAPGWDGGWGGSYGDWS